MNAEEGAAPKPPPNWLGRAWDDYIDNFQGLVPVILVSVLLNAPTFYIIDRWHSYVPALFYMALVLSPISLGLNLSFIRAVRREGGLFAAVFSAFPVYGRALAVAAGLGLMTLAGLALFIVPGVVAYSTYCFSEYAVVDRRTGIKDSFAFSAAITDGWRIPVFLLTGMLALIEVVVPNPVYVSGTLAEPQIKTDFTFWAVSAFSLKALVFLPWLRLAMARAYVSLSSARFRG